MKVHVDTSRAEKFLDKDIFEEKIRKAVVLVRDIYQKEDSKKVLGWLHVSSAAIQLDEIKAKAKEVRKNAEIFVIVGVGGSNQAARAMIEALKEEDGP